MWRGQAGSYPDGIEDFSAYALPSTVECSADKQLRSYLDVTAGCLTAVQVSSYCEDDLYVASWRMDGVAQIQRKHCGTYTALEIDKSYGAPSPRTWHWIRFDAIGCRCTSMASSR